MRSQLITVEDITAVYTSYHQVNFACPAEELPPLDMTVQHANQHSVIFLGRRSASEAPLVVKLLRQLALWKALTLIVVVPYSVSRDDFTEYGFVRTARGWSAVC